MEQRIAFEFTLATPKPWASSLLLTEPSGLVKGTAASFAMLGSVSVRASNGTAATIPGAPPNFLVSTNYLRVAGASASAVVFDATHPLHLIRNAYVLLHWVTLAKGDLASALQRPGSNLFAFVSLEEAETLRRYLAFAPQRAVPQGVVCVLWTRRGTPLGASCRDAAELMRPFAASGLVVARFFNCDLWYSDAELAELAKQLGVGPQDQPRKQQLEQFLRSAAVCRRRENMNIGSSSLSGVVIPVSAPH